jgi:hypothetical protein
VRGVALAAGLLLATFLPLAAQKAPTVKLYVTLASDSAPAGARAPVVRSENLLAGDSRWLAALRSGLPLRLHYRVEVWRSREGWFDIFTRQAEWDVLVRHEPLLDQFTMLTFAGARRQERRYATLDALGAALGFAYQINVQPVSKSRPCRIPISTSWSDFWPGISDDHKAGTISAMLWDEAPPAFSCAWPVYPA